MLNFTYYTPTKVAFVKGQVERTGELAKEYGATKVLVHYGSERVKKSGLLAQVEASLDAQGIAYVELGGVVPNPRLSKVYEGIELCKKEGVDFLLAVGGGSVADSAKAIGYGLYNEGDVWDFYDMKRKPEGAVPVGVVLTIAATGSEMSNSSVITKEEGGLKRSCNTDYIRPKFSVLDPTLTMSLPWYQTACGCTDIMMHTLERYLNNGGYMEITDEIAEGLLRTVMKNALILKDDPENYEARAEVMWAGSLSHNGLTGCGSDGGDWACHRLEHELSGLYDVAHGAGLAAIWSSCARYVLAENPARFAKLAVNVLGAERDEDDTVTALRGIRKMEKFFHAIDMPVTLQELGVDPTDEEYKTLARKAKEASATGTLGSVKKLYEADMEAIFRMAGNKK